ncbi:hypothetical protein GCM10020256_74580 [Streptomyces thermocoprophilus]
MAEYNSVRPHQALDMQSPADRFTPVAEQERDVLGLRVPGGARAGAAAKDCPGAAGPGRSCDG